MKADDQVALHFPRLKPEQKKALAKLGIETVRDLLYHFPARHEAAGPTGTIASAAPGADVTLYGTIRKPETRKAWKSRRPIAEAWLEDASGRIKVMWFNQPYIAKSLADGMVVKATGKIAGSASKKYLANPEIDRSPVTAEDMHDTLFKDATATGEETLYAIYPESKGVSSLWFLHAMKRLFESRLHESIEDPIPAELLERYHLPSLSTAFVWMHMPKKPSDAEAAKKRFAFEEVFSIQLGMEMERRKAAHENALPVAVDRARLDEFVASFPFPPTDAQKRVLEHVVSDFEKAHPMRRLLEGDVGSGKTAVAAATA
ncbi:MAG TPA: OB-fold nucleic acid binding domain-containing protein, partial [Candidatus Paceibacterota bacterium]|nr:OB-fold nucleic acid binding domain-containing protein [Candidatus Paceibacterota bacterium]